MIGNLLNVTNKSSDNESINESTKGRNGIDIMVRWLTSLLLCVVVLPTHAAKPGTEYLTLWGVSYHADRSQGDCEFNIGVGYQQFVSKHIYYTAGVYRNSPCQAAPYAMLGYELDVVGENVGVGVLGGLVGGYTEDNFTTAPLLPGLPYVRIGKPNSDWHTKLIIVPAQDPIFAFTVNHRIGQYQQTRPNHTLQLNLKTERNASSNEQITARWKLNF